MARALVCSYDFPPSSGASALRASAVARYFSTHDYETLVIHEDKVRDNILEPGTFGGQKSKFVEFPTINEFRPIPIVRLFLRLLPENSYWFFKARKMLNRYEKLSSPEIIYCVGYPFVSHVVGLYWKIKNPGSKLIVDFVDPWSLHPGTESATKSAYSRFLASLCEVLVFAFSERVFFSNKYARELYVRKFGLLFKADKFSSFIFGFDRFKSENDPELSSKFTIGFIGNVQGRQKPIPLLRSLVKLEAEISDLKVRWIGRFLTRETMKEGHMLLSKLSDMEYREYIPFKEMVEVIGRNSINVMLSHDGIQTPSKLSLLMASRIPLLVIYNVLPDEAAELVTGYNKGAACANDEVVIVGQLLSMYSAWKEGSLESRFDQKPLRSYEWDNLLEQAFRGIAEV